MASEAKYLFTDGASGAACTQAHRLDDTTIRVTFWLLGHEPPPKGYTASLENACAASARFLRHAEFDAEKGFDVAVTPGEATLRAALEMLEPAEAFGLADRVTF